MPVKAPWSFSGFSCVPYHLSRELLKMSPATGKVTSPFLPPIVAGEHHSGSWNTSPKWIYPRGPWAVHAEPALQHKPMQGMQLLATALPQTYAPERTKTISLQHFNFNSLKGIAKLSSPHSFHCNRKPLRSDTFFL